MEKLFWVSVVLGPTNVKTSKPLMGRRFSKQKIKESFRFDIASDWDIKEDHLCYLQFSLKKRVLLENNNVFGLY